MVDYTTYSWYSESNTPRENKTAFLNWRLTLDMDALTATQLADAFRIELQLDQEIQALDESKAAWYAERDNVFNLLAQKQDTEKQNLGSDIAVAEDSLDMGIFDQVKVDYGLI